MTNSSFKNFHVGRVKSKEKGGHYPQQEGVRLHYIEKKISIPYPIHHITCTHLVGEVDHNLILTTLRHAISTRSSKLLVPAGQSSGSAYSMPSTPLLFSGCNRYHSFLTVHNSHLQQYSLSRTNCRRHKGVVTNMAAQALVSSSSLTFSAEAARQSLGPRSLQSPIGFSRKASFIVKAASTPPVKQGADRPLWFASKQSLSYLDGSLPGDYGFDPLGLSDPEGTGGFIEPKWLAYGEVINGRFAMLGAVGSIAPEILGKAGLIPQETALPWFRTGVFPPAGTYNYWADSYTLFVFELALMGFAEHRRFQDWAKPGSMGKQYFLGLEKGLGGSGEPAYPGGPFFNPLGFGKDEKSLKDLKLKEVKNGRLAMLAILGYFVQALVTGVGPYQNLLDHLADPVHNNVLTSLKFH
ncbi:unnamed protein product [Sphenostylis stenocarpa]|uniref:Chlorophyll a-b binding protein, chloroplastic n=1 Tax=Sphenostylis stenocarpa TaxID=92480 RepID=A0AA86T8S0_9FABA|nr:unnamed protein product [Sphenostylis stenocarpa]